MLPCSRCAYRATVPGNVHIACEYAWDPHVEPIPKGHPRGIYQGWFYFPMLFDPTWGPNDCAAQSDTRDPAKTVVGGSIEALRRLLK